MTVAISANFPEAANQTYKNIYTELTRAGVVALTNAAQLFLGQMAYDAAEYIATGGKGQGKLFFDGKVGEYLSNVGSDAAGEFMASLSDSSFFRGVGFNLCQPRDPGTLLRLQVSLGDLGNQLFPSSSDLNGSGAVSASLVARVKARLNRTGAPLVMKSSKLSMRWKMLNAHVNCTASHAVPCLIRLWRW
jgi:hypothetical protein